MNEKKCSEIQAAIDQMIKEKFPELTVARNNATFGSVSVSFRLEIVEKTESGDNAKYEKDFLFWATCAGFKKEDLHRKFTSRGDEYEIIGWAARKRNGNNVVCKRLRDNALLLWNIGIVKASLLGE